MAASARLLTPIDAPAGDHAAPVFLAQSVRGIQWYEQASDAAAVHRMAAAHGLDEALARILVTRQIAEADAPHYLQPTLKSMMPDPDRLTDMPVAATRLATAILRGQTIGIFGDYDVDGVTATALLFLYLKSLGQTAQIYLPDRIADGYGPSEKAFRQLADAGAEVIVTVDCGASAHGPIDAVGGDNGLDILVLDHHQMDGPPPAGAFAVVNPNRQDDLSGLTNLSAVGVTFMALVAVNRSLRAQGFFKDRPQPDLRQWLDLVALGLICDVMPVTGLTRAMIAQGLKVLTAKLDHGPAAAGPYFSGGMIALANRAGVKTPASPYHLGFSIGPRINAAGRVGHANMAFELLTTSDPTRQRLIAEKLHMMNGERQAIEADVLAAAIAQIDHQIAEEGVKPPVVVAAGEGWHPGVVGIVAGRLKERYGRPALAIGFDNGVGKGSGRSIDGVDLGAAITALRAGGLLMAGGGHAMAAGLTVASDQLASFTVALRDRLTEPVAHALTDRRKLIDGVVAPMAVTAPFAQLIAQAGPFGVGNPEPFFVIRNVHIETPKILSDAHIACSLLSDDGDKARAIAFRCMDEPLGEALLSGKRLHVAGRVKIDEWRGGDAGQFQISDVAFAG
ncbi:MAG: single-stranded-DNA-specific exonuclease RecJ [Pseudomonadota bacterium]